MGARTHDRSRCVTRSLSRPGPTMDVGAGPWRAVPAQARLVPVNTTLPVAWRTVRTRSFPDNSWERK